MKKSIKIVKNRSDIGAGTRGADMGIDAIEIAAINQGNNYFNSYPSEDVETHNESIYNMVRNSFAKRIEHVMEQCLRVCHVVERNIKRGYFPIVLSGDHSSALGTISGIKDARPDLRLGVIWIDAHADLHSPYTSPSGNIHGMPLAAAIGDDNMECQVNEVTNDTQYFWQEIKDTGVNGPKVKPEDIIFFGVRDTEEPEDKQIAKYGIKNYMVAEVRHRGLEICVAEALDKLDDCDHIYISFDVDSLDCDMISYGTGTPVPKGFDQYEVIDIIDQLLASKKVTCLEFVEVNPLLDNNGNKMAETAFEVLDAVTKTIQKTYLPNPITDTQLTDTLLMVRPTNFGFNVDTADNNSFQTNDKSLTKAKIKTAAIKEFDRFVKQLKVVGIEVLVEQERKDATSTDSVFPNNWFSCHEEGLLVTYPMFSQARRTERHSTVIESLNEQFQIKTHIKLEKWEKAAQFLEGTGSMVLDRHHKMVYACRSVRTNEDLLDQFCYFMCYEKVLFDAVDAQNMPIYHTNVMMALGTTFVVICLESIKEKAQRTLLKASFEKTNKTIIDISSAQMGAFAGNMLQVKNKAGEHYLVMSSRAYKALTTAQVQQIEEHTQILHSDLKVIETYGGGSARCMMAEVFLPRK
ncbi:MAG: citrulline utilization hydrolase CtlX [Saprospiraceae bacterium]